MNKFNRKLKKRIGIDLDGVVSDIGPDLAKVLSKINKKIISPYEIISYKLDYFGLPSYEIKKVLNKDFYMNLKPIKGASQTICCLYDENYIEFITSRPKDLMPDTLYWLISNGFLFDNLVNAKNKVIPMKEHNLDFLIDDCFEKCNQLAKAGLDSFLFEQPWNKYYKRDELGLKHIKRVKNWKDIAHQINQCKDIFK